MSDPITVVRRQLDAYNAHDLDAFVATYSPDVRVDRPDGTTLEGADALRAAYAEQFAAARCHAVVENRLTEGRWVVDQEAAHGLADEPIRLLVAYRVTDGRIDMVRFLM
ncbi:nuclear transport factor 2 family protein [Streptomyces alkaliterrae]|uniref:Nuclear transport factor 2 family protein n=1 Tax=Streptomyces alkaliterrae TaxID=2213162 RepID=A0A5P0YYZ7_9ACTN|nr:nuclear transport factor 2 family protein [Streptomyces alkaliterrae]MBB1257075.1 nuclear transport factor 2 family protein [Streptomyces alkaliterrae]MBB1261685.1 nuclear transport factor 2 family protein [Streptomyces alkaliterrae]MQS05471.1 hypothetical protein [Streptomyces alkaliterrae]